MIGANDAGKSRLIRNLAAALDQRAPERGPWSAVIVEVQVDDRESLFSAVEQWDAFDVSGLSDPDRSEFKKDPVTFVWGAIRAAEDEAIARSWETLHAALRDSCLFAFVRDGGGRVPASLHWCLAVGETASPELVAAARRLVSHRASAAGEAETDAGDEENQAGLVLVARLGDISVSQLPAPVFLPTDDAAIVGRATEVIGELARYLAWYETAEDVLEAIASGSIQPEDIPRVSDEIMAAYEPGATMVPEDAQGFGEGVWDELLRRSPNREPSAAWLELAADTVRVKEGVRRTCQVIAGVATRLAPGFIRHRYVLDVSVPLGAVFAGGAPVRFGLTPRASQGAMESVSFATEDLAEGYRIWIQLALLQGIDAVRQVTQDLFRQADDIMWRATEVAVASSHSVSILDLGISSFGSHSLEEARETLAKVAMEHVQTVREFLAGSWPRDDTPLRMRVPGSRGGATRPPLFLIDEPERHLHPRVHRELAAWLRDLVRVHDTQAVVITHAVTFINQADAIAYVTRTASADASVTSCTAEELTAIGKIAADLGLNRGELLARESVFLFVEGLSDKYVVEGLFADRLRRIGVAVCPLHGATQLAQVVDSQMLMRYSTAKVAVLLDNLKAREIEQLLTDPEYRETASRRKTEERAVATLITEAKAQGRELTVLGIPREDIFFLLEENAIRETFRALRHTYAPVADDPRQPYRDYPGHATARGEFETSPHGPKWTGTRWKRFLKDRYGIPYDDVSWYLRVADRMRLDGAFPEDLVQAIDRLELLAIEPP